MDAWFDERTAGMIGGILGTAIGIWGGCVVGGMSWFYIKKGLKKLAYTLWGITVAAGTVLLIIGMIALCVGQPRHVWWPFLLSALITLVVFGWMFFVLRRCFAERERQIMEIQEL
jgi:CHASE2 domain-containing sensor protein